MTRMSIVLLVDQADNLFCHVSEAQEDLNFNPPVS